MSQSEQSIEAIRAEVRRTVQELSTFAQTEENFDTFCDTVMGQVVRITGAYGVLFWQMDSTGAVHLPE